MKKILKHVVHHLINEDQPKSGTAHVSTTHVPIDPATKPPPPPRKTHWINPHPVGPDTMPGGLTRHDEPYEVYDDTSKSVIPASIRHNVPGAAWPDKGGMAKAMGAPDFTVLNDRSSSNDPYNRIPNFHDPVGGAAYTVGMWEKYATKSPKEGGHVGESLLTAVDKWTGHTGGDDGVKKYAQEICDATGGKVKITDTVGPWLYDFIKTDKGLAFLKKQADEESGGKGFPLDDAGWRQGRAKWDTYAHSLTSPYLGQPGSYLDTSSLFPLPVTIPAEDVINAPIPSYTLSPQS